MDTHKNARLNNSGLPQGLADHSAAGWACGKPTDGGTRRLEDTPMFGDYFTGATFAAKSWYDLKASLPKRLRCEQIGNGRRLNKLSRGTAAHSCVAAPRRSIDCRTLAFRHTDQCCSLLYRPPACKHDWGKV